MAQAQASAAEQAWVPQFVQCALAVKAENLRLQEYVRLLEASLKQAMLDIQQLKEHHRVPAAEPSLLTPHTPSTASSSPAGTRPRDKPADLVFDGLTTPPGLALAPPLGLTHPLTPDSEKQVEPLVSTISSLPPSVIRPSTLAQDASAVADAVAVTQAPVETAEWRIENVAAKLRTSCGFPLISPTFAVNGVSDLRFLFVPGEKWIATARERRQRGKPTRAPPSTPPGPLNGALKLKVGQLEQARTLNVKFCIGGVEQGPVTCDFSEVGVQGINFDFDWIKQVDSSGCLGIRFEFF